MPDIPDVPREVSCAIEYGDVIDRLLGDDVFARRMREFRRALRPEGRTPQIVEPDIEDPEQIAEAEEAVAEVRGGFTSKRNERLSARFWDRLNQAAEFLRDDCLICNALGIGRFCEKHGGHTGAASMGGVVPLARGERSIEGDEHVRRQQPSIPVPGVPHLLKPHDYDFLTEEK